MTRQSLFDQFVKRCPVAVMVQAALQYAYSPKFLDQVFAKHAERQREGELLFSTVADLLSLVVLKVQPSMHAAWKDRREEVQVSVQSIYNKLDGVETQVSRALVRESAKRLEPVLKEWSPVGTECLGNYPVRILDGNHLPGTEHRLEVLRYTKAGALPGKSVVVYDPARKMAIDVFLTEDGHAQERSLLPEVLESIEAGQVWMGDRNFCTTGFLFGIAQRKGYFLIRQHGSTLHRELVGRRKKIGRSETGVVYEQEMRLSDPDSGKEMTVRRVTVKLDEPTRDGDTEIHLLTNLPKRVSAKRIATAYRDRWTIEAAFGELASCLHSEINTLGYPGAALLGFCLALVAYNMLQLVQAAIATMHDLEASDSQVSTYFLANEVAVYHGGMMVVLNAAWWETRVGQLSPSEFAELICSCAEHIHLPRYTKSVRGPKHPPPRRTSGAKQKHVSTARLIAAQKS